MRVKYYQSTIALEHKTDVDRSLSCLHPTLQLTDRETDIVKALVEGMNNREIGLALGISDGTVKHHLTRIFDKVGVYSRLELAMWVARNGMLKEREIT